MFCLLFYSSEGTPTSKRFVYFLTRVKFALSITNVGSAQFFVANNLSRRITFKKGNIGPEEAIFSRQKPYENKINIS